MSKVLIIGAGGAGSAIAHKCAQVPDVFSEILLASRTVQRCQVAQGQIRKLCGRDIQVAQLDADDVSRTTALLRGYKPDVVINAALPYQDLHVMDACLAAGVSYVDLSSYGSPDQGAFEYERQWAYRDRYRDAGVMAVLGAGLGPGVTNALCAHARARLYDELHYVDILDCNAGDHGYPFATDYNAEINLRKVTQPARWWEDGTWHDIDAMSESMVFDFPEIGPCKAYLQRHEGLESLVEHIPGLRRIRFWMTFGDQYLTHLRVLQNIGMTRLDPIELHGRPVIPLHFLQALLPDPAALGKSSSGKLCVGVLLDGLQAGKRKKAFVYTVCDHADAYEETRAQGVTYGAGVSAMVAAMMVVTGAWRDAGVFNIEQLDPQPFLDALARHGLPWHVKEL